MAKFTMYRDKANQYRWRLVANNGRTTADSGEGYTVKQECANPIERVKREIAVATVEDLT